MALNATNATKTRALSVRSAVVTALVIASIGSVLASSISINTSKNLEFGQGVFLIKACDSWVTLNLIAGATGTYGAPAGISPLTGLSLSGLNTKACAGIQFTLKAKDVNSADLPLYLAKKSAKVYSVILKVATDSSVALDTTDQYRTLSYSSTTGIYTISFTNPASTAPEVAQLTIESAVI
jgi:hypothetical protein